ncbi:MAG: hypothetical protein JO060_02685, partial [Candidatus Eremiobacteraeota bacterium]|nr:hypothetical protein [Candidatus Eremiobacteraeota bacterium]
MRTIVRCFLFLAAVPLAIGAAPVTRVNVDDSEARAALYILHKLQRHAVPTDRDWAQLFGTSGYKRLKAREAEFKRPFTDDDFKKFVAGPSLVAKASVLKTTLDAWTSADRSQIEARARAYLPDGAVLHATIYPLIKPKTNSFVYQLDTDPAVMLYVNPAVSADQFSNTVSHELLHVGDAENCPPPDVATSEKNFTVRQKAFLEWLSAFGEGWAVLAAAGGPNVHPHWEDSAADRAVWDAAMSRFATDFADLQTFFSQISDGSLAGD